LKRFLVRNVTQPDTLPVIGKQLLISNDRNRVRSAVLGLSEDGVYTDSFENLRVKRELTARPIE
jgi:hypothetical protein